MRTVRVGGSEFFSSGSRGGREEVERERLALFSLSFFSQTRPLRKRKNTFETHFSPSFSSFLLGSLFFSYSPSLSVPSFLPPSLPLSPSLPSSLPPSLSLPLSRPPRPILQHPPWPAGADLRRSPSSATPPRPAASLTRKTSGPPPSPTSSPLRLLPTPPAPPP